MGVHVKAGHTGNTYPLNHARILHRGQMPDIVATGATAIGGVSGDDTSIPLEPNTYERFRFFADRTPAGEDFSLVRMTYDEATGVARETATTGIHELILTPTGAIAGYNGFAIRVRPVNLPLIRVIIVTDVGSVAYSLDLRTLTGIGSGTGVLGSFRAVGDGSYWLKVSKSSGTVTSAQIRTDDGASSFEGHAGSVTRGFDLLDAKLTGANGEVRFDFAGSRQISAVGIAGHNIGSLGGTVQVFSGTIAGGYGTAFYTFNPTDDSPILALFDATSMPGFMVRVFGAPGAEVASIYAGDALEMARPTYAGHSMDLAARQTVRRSSLSVGGQILGTKKVRTGFASSYQWSNLPAPWAEDNLIPLIKAAEENPIFIAWRPSSFDHVLYGAASSGQVTAQGSLNRHTFSLDVTGVGYD